MFWCRWSVGSLVWVRCGWVSALAVVVGVGRPARPGVRVGPSQRLVVVFLGGGVVSPLPFGHVRVAAWRCRPSSFVPF